jgi:cytidylate kinase
LKPEKEKIHIAIDGFAASGKGSVTRELSRRIGIPCLDTGALYRGVAVFVKNMNSPTWETDLPLLFQTIKLSAKIVDNITRVTLNGTDITDKLRENEISSLVARVAQIPAVRELCTKIAQDIAARQSLICEGRDICAVVIPNAKYKFFLTAKTKVRAKRRYNELVATGFKITYKQVLRETKLRDKRDRNRTGFVKPKDAIVIDSSKDSVEAVVDKLLEFIK